MGEKAQGKVCRVHARFTGAKDGTQGAVGPFKVSEIGSEGSRNVTWW